MQLESIGSEFLVFINAETDRVNVVYRRHRRLCRHRPRPVKTEAPQGPSECHEPDTIRGRGSAVQVCIVTGLSGAGKSTALRVFEDLRYFTVDGLPAGLAVEMVEMMRRGSMERFRGMALGMDMRQQDFLEELNVALAQLSEHGVRPILLFLEAGAQELMRRYATTRRPHPLEREGMGLEDALHEERTRLAPVREMADLVIDTSRFPSMTCAAPSRSAGAGRRASCGPSGSTSSRSASSTASRARRISSLTCAFAQSYFVEKLRPPQRQGQGCP